MLMIKVTSNDEVTQGVIKGGEEFKAQTQDTPKIQRPGRMHELRREAVMENQKDRGSHCVLTQVRGGHKRSGHCSPQLSRGAQ